MKSAIALELLEAQATTNIKTMGLRDTLVALHNACAFGRPFESISDAGLKALMDTFDAAIKIAKTEDL